jgi:hypothetical protein
MVERMTEKVKVTLVDGKEAEVLLYKTIPFRRKQLIESKLLSGMNISKSKASKPDDVEFPAERLNEVLGMLAEEIWADQNYKLDDVEGDSFSAILADRLNSFLGRFGVRAEAEHNTGGKQ